VQPVHPTAAVAVEMLARLGSTHSNGGRAQGQGQGDRPHVRAEE